MNFMYIWHDGRYRSRVLLSTISYRGSDLEVKVADLNFHIKVKMSAFWFI